MKKEEESEVRGARGLIECGCACSRWPVVDSPRIGGKLWVGPLSYMSVVSMLSAFTFREFRVINRRAGDRCTYVCMRVCVRVLVNCARSCSEVSPAAPMRWREAGRKREGSRIFGTRAIYAPRFLAPSCRVAKRNSSRRGARKRPLLHPSEKGRRRPARPLFLIASSTAIRTLRAEPPLVYSPHYGSLSSCTSLSASRLCDL